MVGKSVEHHQYRRGLLERNQLVSDPWQQFGRWYEEAELEERDPSAMCLSSSSLEGQPSARMVLMSSFGEQGLTFFTHYDSRKGREIRINPRVACVFYWPQLERQVTLEGGVELLAEELSDAYFLSRPLQSQVATSISRQGQPVASRELLLAQFHQGLERIGSMRAKRPPWWGGYLLKPSRFEFWQGRDYRLHDRFEFTLHEQRWQIQRLSP